MKLAPQPQLEIGTYTADKIKVIGSCRLLVVHPDIPCLKEVTFNVISHEGSVVLSCVTTLDLCFIQPCSNLDSIPSSASLIASKANYLRKKKSQKYMLVSKPKKNVCSRKEQSPKLLLAQGYSVNQCVMYEDKEETNKQKCQANVISKEDDKNCQSNNCVNMQSVTQPSYMQLAKPAVLQSDYKKKKSVCDDKNCQSTQCVHMQAAMKLSYMWSVTKPSHMHLPKPAIKQSTNMKFNQDYKNCQYTKKYSSEECPVRPVCNDKSCHSAKPMCCNKKCRVKSEGMQSFYMLSVPKTACKQIGTQPEITRINAHTVLPTHDHFLCQQALCEYSASKSCYPSETTKVSPVSRNYKKHFNHSDSRSSMM